MLEEEVKRAEDVFDSHPSLKTRTESVRDVQVDGGKSAPIEIIMAELVPVLDRLSDRLNEAFSNGDDDG